MLGYLAQAALLGALQGVTEFLPVSSTAHLAIAQRLMHLDPEVYGLTFDMFTNLGTLAAVVLFFWRDIVDMLRHLRLPVGRPLTTQERLPWLIILATIPAGIVGLLLEEQIESDFRSLQVIAASLIVVGALMLLADRQANRQPKGQRRPDRPILLMGLAQVAALIPGVSRSGSTITAGLFAGLDRVAAARYSFLLSIPITSAATFKKVAEFAGEAANGQVADETLIFYAVGGLVSFVTAYFTIKYLLAFYRRHSLSAFAYYRFALAAVILLAGSRIG